jgi:hypothetical protein
LNVQCQHQRFEGWNQFCSSDVYDGDRNDVFSCSSGCELELETVVDFRPLEWEKRRKIGLKNGGVGSPFPFPLLLDAKNIGQFVTELSLCWG